MPKRPIRALLLSDGKPGHYHQADGVLAAIQKLRPAEAQRIQLQRRRLIATRTLQQLLNAGASPRLVLKLGYGIGPEDLPDSDIVISAGGETLAANSAAAALLKVPNIFCGRLRRLAPEWFSVVVVAQEKLALLPNHLLCLPPSAIETDARAKEPIRLGRATPPRLLGALIGGDSGAVRYQRDDWQSLIRFLSEIHSSHGVRWVATTSRRSGAYIAGALAALAAEGGGGMERFIDYSRAGAGTVSEILNTAEAILVTEDSTTMISEAVGACVPVVGIAPDHIVLEEREAEFRAFLSSRGWYRSLRLSELTPDAFLDALARVRPRRTSALEELALALRQRLPDLLAAP